MAAFVDTGEATTLIHEARGYCRRHRDDVPGRFLADAQQRGTIQWSFDSDGEEPAELRPAEVDDWWHETGTVLMQAASESGAMPNAYQPIDPAQGLPRQCPHCAGQLSWGTGPHAAEAAAYEGHGIAWECPDCGAAGLLM